MNRVERIALIKDRNAVRKGLRRDICFRVVHGAMCVSGPSGKIKPGAVVDVIHYDGVSSHITITQVVGYTFGGNALAKWVPFRANED